MQARPLLFLLLGLGTRDPRTAPSTKRRGIWFRFFLLVPTAVWTALLAWFAAHRSLHPAVLGRYSTSYAWVLAGMLAVATFLMALQFGGAYRWAYRQRRGLVALAVSTLLSLLLLEMLARATDPLGISYYAEVDRYVSLLLPDDDIIYKMRPGLRTRFFNADVTLNDLGLRERPVGPKEPGEFRVLLLGDSVTFGNGVKQDETFSRLLEPLLTTQLGRPVRTINTGVGSYNTMQEAAYLDRDGLKLDPDMVVLVYVQNDFFEHHRPFVPGAPQVPDSPHRKLLEAAKASWLFLLPYHLIRSRDPMLTSIPRENDPGFVASMEALRSMARRLGERSTPFVVFLWRTFPDELTDFLYLEIEKVAREEKFRLGDAGPWFKDIDLHRTVNSVVDSHPNARGHKIVAEGMAAFLRSVSGTSTK